ncbi:MAG: ABC transporter permease subunit [Actinomycetia bacterium]|nr:ABC transporter permease subunit [Actinomycetes bacterium]
MGILAQTEAGPSWTDNEWTESFNFPFGEWIKQLVFWAVNNPVTAKIGDIIEWPFESFFDLILSEKVGRDSIQTIPWVWVVIAVFVIGSFTRNTRVGLASAAMLSICGFLGAEYWSETSRTIGMILVSVTLCAIVGIPVGVISGRVDSVWNIVRPTLDAMQVVHSFVFMLPFIFFFGIGEVSATMVTMVFALPPIVRLTNLGVRQVPEDVVEASRAFGATETRVLFDVQLPLARPAILAGLNQTLLLAISMLGIAALMGAGGLGRLLFRAINNLNLGLAASGGLAFFLVAVVFDRITQSEEHDDLNLFKKITLAWRFRAEPQAYLDATHEAMVSAGVEEGEQPEGEDEPAERLTPVKGNERLGLLIGAVASVATLIAVVLPWAKDAGAVSSWGRRADEELLGQSFNGFEASGGSFFGVFVGIFAILALLASVRPLLGNYEKIVQALRRGQGICLVIIAALGAFIWLLNMFFDEKFIDLPVPSVWNDEPFGALPELGLVVFGLCVVFLLLELFMASTPRLGADGAFVASIVAFLVTLGFIALEQSVFVTDYSNGIGVWLALITSAAMMLGTGMAAMSAPYSPRHPLPLAKTIVSARNNLIIVGVVLSGAAAALFVVFNWLVAGDRFQDALDGVFSDGAANWIGGILNGVVLVGGLAAIARVMGSQTAGDDEDEASSQVAMGAMFGGLAMLITFGVIVVLSDSVFSGSNEFLVTELGLIAAVGAMMAGVTSGQIGAAIFATLMIVGSAFGIGNAERKTQYGWYYDGRIESLITPEVQAEFDRLEEEAGDDITKQLAAGQAIVNKTNSLQSGGGTVHSGVADDGPGLAWLSMGLGLMAILVGIVASGVFGGGEVVQWRATTVTTGIGLGIALIPMAFILGIVRVDDSGGDVLGGIGAFATFIAGIMIFVSGRSVVAEFRRTKIYAEYKGDGLVETVIGVGDGDEADLVGSGG